MYFFYKVRELFIVLFTVGYLAILNSSYAQDQLSYQDITSLGASCAPDDTCVGFKNNTYSFSRTCDCDENCSIYGTCCIDSPYIQSMNVSREVMYEVSCIHVLNYYLPIFGVNKCKQSWADNMEWKSLCETENFTNFEDPVSMIPVTNPTTGITYKNYFCARCNDLNDQNIVFWEVRIDAPKRMEESELREQLVYNETLGQWGIMNNNPCQMSFETVSINFSPGPLQKILHDCFPDLISTCHPNWTDDAVKEKCSAYMGRVYAEAKNLSDGFTSRKFFKNVHCAICNFAKYKPKNLCSRYGNEMDFGGPSSPLVLHVNISDGSNVGEEKRCQQGEIYDPFHKQCRAMKCKKLGYRFKDKKCVPSQSTF